MKNQLIQTIFLIAVLGLSFTQAKASQNHPGTENVDTRDLDSFDDVESSSGLQESGQITDLTSLLPSEILMYLSAFADQKSLSQLNVTSKRNRSILKTLLHSYHFRKRLRILDPSLTSVLTGHPNLGQDNFGNIYQADPVKVANFLEAIVDTQIFLLKFNSLILSIYEMHSEFFWGYSYPGQEVYHITLAPMTFLVQHDFEISNTCSTLDLSKYRDMCLNYDRARQVQLKRGSYQPLREDFYRKKLIDFVGTTPNNFASDNGWSTLSLRNIASEFILVHLDSLKILAASTDLNEYTPMGDYQLKRKLLSGDYKIDTSRIQNPCPENSNRIIHISGIERSVHNLLDQLEYARLIAIKLISSQ